MKKALLLLIFIFSLSCKGDKVDPLEIGTGDIRIRVWNGSEYTMDDVYVNTSGGEHEYGEVKKGVWSTYRRFEAAYRYAFISFKVDGKSFAIQPIDYVGEIPLEKGDYTYKISIPDLNATSATLEFMED